MTKTEGKFVVESKKAQCCSVGGGKSVYSFCKNSTEVLATMIDWFGRFGGDNYFVAEYESIEDIIESCGQESFEAQNAKGMEFPVQIIYYNGPEPELHHFTDELEYAEELAIDVGDYTLSICEADDCDIEEKEKILKAENQFDDAIEDAFDNLW